MVTLLPCHMLLTKKRFKVVKPTLFYLNNSKISWTSPYFLSTLSMFFKKLYRLSFSSFSIHHFGLPWPPLSYKSRFEAKPL